MKRGRIPTCIVSYVQNKRYQQNKIIMLLLSVIFFNSLLLAHLAYAQAGVVLWSDGFETSNFSGWDAAPSGWNRGTASPSSQAGFYRAMCNGSNSLVKTISTAGYESITITFYEQTANSFEVSGIFGGEHVYAEWWDGSTWNQIADISSNSSSWREHTVTLGTGANNNSNFRLRFRPSSLNSSDNFYLDAVSVSGTVMTYSIGDRVWYDADGDGTQDAAETGLNSVTVELWNNAHTQLLATQVTNSSGNYTFSGLQNGSYKVDVDETTLPVGYVLTTSSLPLSVTIAGASITSADLGYRGTSSIGNRVWHDVDHDGVQDSNEPGLNGVTVQLYQGTTLLATQTTTGDGNYNFTNLFAGAYRVEVIGGVPSDMALTTANLPFNYNLPTGQTYIGADFGYDHTGVIGDLIWNDADGDGTFDTGESGLNWQVSLTDQSNTTITQTAVSGVYSFVGVPTGVYYTVTVTAPNGWVQTNFINNPLVLNLPAGTPYTTADFGFNQTSANISGYVWYDPNRNGIRDSDETTNINGMNVDLYRGTTYVRSASTNSSGFYFFGGLTPGDYSVRETGTPPNPVWTLTTANPQNVSGVAAGQSYPNHNFGFSEPAAVVKRLYLSNNPTDHLDRIVPSGSTKPPHRIDNDTSSTWVQTPTLASNLVLNGAAINVGLWLEPHRATYWGYPGNYPNVLVELLDGTTVIGSAQINQLPEGGPVYYPFTFTPNQNTIAQGHALTLKVSVNGATGTTPGYVLVYYASSGNDSSVDLPTYSYLKIDVANSGTYDATYPGGASSDTFLTSDTVYFRARATDPFGNYDITSMVLNIPGVITNAAMTRYLPNPDSATAVYQLPRNGFTLGSYNYTITATEGAEGVVKSIITSTFRVIISDLTESFKEVRSWPARQPITQTVPGAEIEYTVHISNTGDANATTVSVIDPIPARTAYVVSSVSGAVYSPTINAIVWPGSTLTGTIPARTERTFSFRVKLDPVLDNGLFIENSALVNDGVNQFARSTRTTVVSAPDLTPSRKTVDHSPTAEPGDVLKYTLTLTNTGNMNASASLTDIVPANTTFVDGSLAATVGNVAYNAGTRTVSWNGVVPGQNTTPGVVVVTFQAKVDFPLANGTVITNTAFIDDGFAPNGAVPLERQVVTTVTAEPLLQISSAKLVDEPTANPGDTLHYTIHLINSGKMAAPVVTLTDVLPPYTSWAGGLSVNGGAAATWDGSQITWSGPVNPNAPVEIRFNVRADSVLTNGLIITNTAFVTDNYHSGNFALPATTVIESAPNLRDSSKSVSASSAQPGDVLTYTLNLVNTGDMVAATRVTDTLSPDLVNVVVLSPPEASYNSGLHAIVWVGKVAPGVATTVRFRAGVRSPLNAPQTIIYNTATVDDGSHQPFDIYPPTQTTVNAAPDLSTSRKAVNTATANPGDELTYTIILTNSGNMNTWASVQDVLPNQTTYKPGSLSFSTGSGSYDTFNNWIQWDGPANPGEPVIITYLAVVNPVMNQAETIIYNDARLDDGVHQPFLTPGVTTTVQAQPNLSTSTKVVDLTDAAPGQQLWYRITVRNSGNMVAHSATVSDTLPAQVSYVSGQFPTGGGYNASGRYIYWTGDVTPGTDVVIDYYVTVKNPLSDGVVITNSAQVGDGVHAVFETGAATTVVHAAPNMSGTSKGVDKGTAAPGEVLRYTITLVNSGDMTAVGAVVTDAVPAHTSYVAGSVSGNASYESGANRIRWSGWVTPGVAVEVSYQVKVDTPLTNGVVIENVAQVADGYHGEVLTRAASTIIGSAPNLGASSKGVSAGTAEPGAVLTYTLVLRNTGNQNATNVTVTDALPAAVSYQPGSVTGGASYAGGVISWAGAVTAGGQVTMSYRVVVALPLDNGTVIENRATVNDGVNAAFETSPPAQTVVQATPNLLGSDKAVSRAEAGPGETVVYTITLRNSGKMTAGAATVADTLPAGVSLVGQPWASAGLVSYTGYNRRISWSGSVSPLQAVTVVFTAAIQTPLDDGTQIINTATVGDGIHAAFDLEPAVTVVRSAPNLSSSVKSVDRAEAAPGEQLRYTLRLTNTGNMVAQGSVEDELPAEVSYFSGPTASAGSATWDGFSRRVLWNGPVTPGTAVVVQYYVTVNNPLDNGTVIANRATVNDGVHAGFETGVATTTIHAAPNLAGSSKSVDKSSAAPGEVVEYALTLVNSGDMTAHTAVVTDVLPANTSWAGGLSWSSGTATWDGSQVRWQGEVSRAAAVVIRYRAQVNTPLGNGTVITNTAAIDDGSSRFNRVAVTTIHATPNLAGSSKTVNAATANPGEALTYTLTLVNSGDMTAAATVADTLPGNVSFAAVVAGPGSYNAGSNAVTWSGWVTPGVAVVIQYRVVITRPLGNGTVIANTATVNDGVHTAFEVGPAQTVVQSEPNLSQSRKTVSAATASPGQVLTYTIILTNSGSMNAAAYVQDTLPAHTSYVAGSVRATSGAVSYNATQNRLEWDGEAPVGTPVRLEYAVRVDTPLDDGVVIWNTATVGDGVHAPFETAAANTVIVAAPNLAVSTRKTVNLAEAGPGSILRYTITLVNDGNMAANNATVVDGLPGNVSFASGPFASAGSVVWDSFNRQVLWNGSVVPGTPVTVQYDVRVNTPLADGVVITNSAQVGDGVHAVFETGAATTVVHAAPNMSGTSKGVDKGTAAPGEVLRYTITLVNSGDMTAAGAVVTDAVPAHTSYVAGSVSGNASYESGANRIRWSGWVTPGVAVEVSYQVKVDTPLTNGVVIENVAQVADGYHGEVLTRTASTIIGSAPNLGASSKGVSAGTAEPGAVLTYTLVLRNTGNMIGSVSLTDTLPARTTWAGWVSPNNAQFNAGTITWAGKVEPGVDQVVAYRVQVDTPLDNNTLITNAATVADGVNPAVTIGPAQTIIQSTPNLTASFKAVSQETASPGQQLVYTITLRNNGKMTAHQAEVVDNIPAYSTYVSGSAAASSGLASYQSLYKRIHWAGDVAPGTDVVITFKVQLDLPLDDGVQVINGATVDDKIHAPFDTNTVTTIITAAPDLSRSGKAVNLDSAHPGDLLNYTITLVNDGLMTSRTRVDDVLPANVTFESGPVVSGGGSGGYDGGTRRIYWSGQIPPAQTVTVVYYVRVNTPLNDGTLITNTAAISDGYHAGVLTTNMVETRITAAPNLATSAKTVDKTTASPGDRLRYTITLNNSGDMNAANVTVVDTLPISYTTLVAVPAGADYNSSNGTLTWNGLTVNRNQPVALTFEMQLDTAIPNGVVIANAATINDGFAGHAEIPVQAKTTIGSAPNLATSRKEVSQTSAIPGETLVYTITVRNSGNMVAATALTDALPNHTTWVDWVTQNNAQLNASVVNWQGEVVPGVDQVIAFRVRVDSPLDNGVVIANSASVSDGFAGHNLVTISAPGTVVQAAPNLKTSAKTVNLLTARPGSQLAYTITLTNSGDMTAYNALVLDEIPAHSTYVSATATAGAVQYQSAYSRIRWTGNVVPGTAVVITLYVQVDTPLNNNIKIDNFAVIDDRIHAEFDSNTVTTTINSGPDLTSSAKTVNKATAAPGEVLRYTITLTNSGDMIAQANVSDYLPVQVTYAGGPTVQNGAPASWDAINRHISWSGQVAPGSNVVIEYYGVINTPLDDGTLITNTATLNDGVNTAFETAPAQTVAHSAADLSGSTKTVDKSIAAPGQAIEYTITLRNGGTRNAPNAVLTDTLPANVSYIDSSIVVAGGGVAAYNAAENQIRWTGAVNVGQSVAIRYRVRLDSNLPGGTSIENTATVADGWGTETEIGPATTVAGYQLGLSLTDERETVQPGERITYTAVISGADPLGIGYVQLDIPVGTTLVTASPNYQNAAGYIYWTFFQSQPNFRKAFAMVVELPPVMDNGTIINTTAQAAGNGQSNQAAASARVVASPNLETSAKTVNKPGAHAGETVTYQIALTNTGNMHAHTAVVTDAIPAQVQYTGDMVASRGVATYTAGQVLWNGEVAVGSPVVITFNVRLDDTASNRIENLVDINDGLNPVIQRSAFIAVGAAAPPVGPVYLPLIMSGSTASSGQDVAVTIRNCGSANAVGAFWVDLYFNPDEKSIYWPIGHGEGYNWFGQGAGFTVSTLGAGQSLTLHLSDAVLKNMPGSLPSLPRLYAQVDLFDSSTPGMGVVNEGSAGETNNVAGSEGSQCHATAGLPDLIVESIKLVNKTGSTSASVEAAAPAADVTPPPVRVARP